MMCKQLVNQCNQANITFLHVTIRIVFIMEEQKLVKYMYSKNIRENPCLKGKAKPKKKN